jgi:hypothetical protein
LTKSINVGPCGLTPILADKRIIHSTARSLSRIADAKAEVGSGMSPGPVAKHLGALTKPNSLNKTMRKVGVALLASPDMVTNIPGAALLAASYARKGKEPADLAQLALETRKILREMSSLTL